MGRALGVLAVCAVGVPVGVYTLVVVHRSPAFSFAGASTAGAVALLAAGYALIGSAVGFWVRRPTRRLGPLLAAAGVAWFVVEWRNPGVGSALVFTAGVCLYAACPALVGHTVLAYPGGRLRSHAERTAVAVAYAGSVLVLGLLPAVLYDPVAEGCNQCPRNLLLVADRGHAVADLRRVGVYVAVAWAFALCLLVLVRLARRPPGSPVLLAGALYLGLVGATFAASTRHGLLWNGTFERRLWLAQAGMLVALAAGVAWTRLQSRRARSNVARLVLELAHAPPPGGLRDVLATIVGDPGLVLAYPVGSGRLVDVEGRPVEPGARPAQTSVVGDGRLVAVLGHATGLFDDEELVEQVSAAARLALDNERLQAEVRARVDDLRASRSRIVAAGDAERRRLERDLHDGAQQRLVALALSLRLLSSKLVEPDAAAKLRDAEVEVDRAIADLRDMARGIFPAVLADGGLAVAVRALAEDGPVPIQADGLPERRLSGDVEAAAYAVVAEAALGAVASLRVNGRERDGVLVVEVETSGAAAIDRVSLEDRLGALDGTLTVDRNQDGGSTIRAVIPCES
jgi:signal transduction histidine kinase